MRRKFGKILTKEGHDLLEGLLCYDPAKVRGRPLVKTIIDVGLPRTLTARCLCHYLALASFGQGGSRPPLVSLVSPASGPGAHASLARQGGRYVLAREGFGMTAVDAEGGF